MSAGTSVDEAAIRSVMSSYEAALNASSTEAALRLAATCGALLPELKARRGLDQRAPQNLLPISALERFLRRKLGDERIIRRKLETFLVREAN